MTTTTRSFVVFLSCILCMACAAERRANAPAPEIPASAQGSSGPAAVASGAPLDLDGDHAWLMRQTAVREAEAQQLARYGNGPYVDGILVAMTTFWEQSFDASLHRQVRERFPHASSHEVSRLIIRFVRAQHEGMDSGMKDCIYYTERGVPAAEAKARCDTAMLIAFRNAFTKRQSF